MSDNGISRRGLLAAVGASIGGTVLLTSGDGGTASAASVEYGTFEISDTSKLMDGKEVTDVQLSATAEWSYDTNRSPDSHVVELLCGDYDSQSVIASKETTDIPQQDSGTTDLSGSILETYHYSVQEFNPSVGNTKSHNVYAGVRFKLKQGGEVLDSAKAVGNAYIEVTNEEVIVDTQAGGSGEFTVVTG
jgi:hypothetical protein